MQTEQAVAAQGYLQKLYRERLFTDFTVIAGGQKFPAHRAILAQHAYFAGLLKHDFVESSTNQIVLPESPKVVEALLRFLYGFPLEQLSDDELDFFGLDHVALYTAADKYQVLDLKSWAFTQWTKLFDYNRYVHPKQWKSLMTLAGNMHDRDLKIDVFEDFVVGRLLRTCWREGVPYPYLKDLLAANAHLTEETIRKYVPDNNHLPRTNDGEGADWREHGHVYDSTCPSCSRSWRWQNFQCDLKLRCPFCGGLSRWIDYVLEAVRMFRPDAGTQIPLFRGATARHPHWIMPRQNERFLSPERDSASAVLWTDSE